MYRLSFASVLVTILASTSVHALPRPQDEDKSINKPVLFDDGTIGEITNKFYDYVQGVKYSVTEWEPDFYPQACISESQSNNKCPVSDLKVYDVTYEDCPQPWTMCRCSGSQVTPERLFEFFARVPVKARAEIRHMFAWPDQEGLAAYAFGPDIGLTNPLQTGDGKQDMNAIIHEAGHVLDQGASDSPEMIDAINRDDCALRPYSLVSRGENLGNLMVMTYFRMINREEYDRVHNEKGMGCLQNQLDFMERMYSERMTPGGTCPPRKHENSERKNLPGGILTKKDLGLLKRELPPGKWIMHEDHGMYPGGQKHIHNHINHF